MPEIQLGGLGGIPIGDEEIRLLAEFFQTPGWAIFTAALLRYKAEIGEQLEGSPTLITSELRIYHAGRAAALREIGSFADLLREAVESQKPSNEEGQDDA